MSAELLAAVPDPRIGTLVHERYRILKRLGEGGMGAVYEGEHTLIHRKVAIKCLHAHLTTNAEMVRRFEREAKAANAIRHPNIVEVTDMGRFDDGAMYLVLELLEGRDLATLLAKERVLTVARAVHIVSQVCDALGAAQEVEIVHRDLKPENIFLITRGRDDDFVKVLDFGIAKFAHATGPITRGGSTIGTPHYMSPEHAFGSTELDHRADIYSLGVVLFQCLSGVLPYDDETYPGMLMKIVNMPAPRLADLSPEIPAELGLLVERMLAKDPDERPQSFAEVKEALAAFRELDASFAATKKPLARVTTPIDPYDPSESPPISATHDALPKRAPLAPWGIGALLVIAAIAIFFAYGAGETRAPPAPAAARVRVQIETEPANAELSLDGAEIANPFDADVPPSDRPRRLEARLAGHQPVARSVVLSMPQRIRLVLTPDPPEEPIAAVPIEPPVAEPAVAVAPPIARRPRRPPPAEPVAAPIEPVEPAPVEPPPRREYRPVVLSDEL